MDDERYIWVFSEEGARFPAAVFSSRGEAHSWISKHQLSGVLTAYPLNESAYEWAIRKSYFAPKREEQKSPPFIQRFTSASPPHFHYELGVCEESE